MATYRNSNEEDRLLDRVKTYIKGLGYYAKPRDGIPASDLARWVLPSAVTDYSVGGLGYTKNHGTVTSVIMNGEAIPETEEGVLDMGDVQPKIDADHKLSADLITDGATNKVINVKPDWNAASGADAEILNKPTIPDVSGKEDVTNKVTSLSSSSTDTQYPSAKCVFDLVGDIETILASI